MTGTVLLRSLLIIVAFLSPFFFPFPATLVFSFIASIVYPPIGIAVGILTDALYGGTQSWYLGTLSGAGISGIAFFVRRFIKTRIIV